MQYIKIKDAIIEQIESGLLPPQQKLPPERKLAEAFNTTRVTLREALSLLETEGCVYREDRRGWFISPPSLSYDPSQFTSFFSMAQIQNRIPSLELISAEASLADKTSMKLLELPAFADVYCINSLYLLDKRPVMFAIHYSKPDCFPGLLEQDLKHLCLWDIYEQHYGLVSKQARYRVATRSLLGDIAQALNATEGTPCLLIEKIHYDSNGKPLFSTTEYWRHDAISIESHVALME